MQKNPFLSLVAFSLLSLAIHSCHQVSDKAQQPFINTEGLDSSVKPGDNFFLYTDGKWFNTVKIPPTERGVGSFYDLGNTTRKQLKTILDSVCQSKNIPGSIAQKVGDFYASGMDSATIEKRRAEPVTPYLQQIDAIKDIQGIRQYVAGQQKQNNGILFNEYIGPDEKSSMMNIAVFSQGGLGLPDRDYYFKNDSATKTVVKAFQTYIQKLFTLTGDDTAAAAKKMQWVYSLEKEMAASHKTNIELRDPLSNYHKTPVAELDKKMPAFGWKATLEAMGMQADSVNVQQPAFYTKLDHLLKTTPIDTWKAYLRFHILSAYDSWLSSDFVNARFDYLKAITGQQKIKPRWERMVGATDGILGEALGQLYVQKYFTKDAKSRMLDLVNNLQKAFETRIGKLDWMSDSTKVKAKDKLYAFIKKIGFPDKWRDYSKVKIGRSTYFENRVSGAENEYQYQLAKLGKRVDRTEWVMTPPTINAYYNPTFNEIVFPAGILQFPFFDATADDAVNYGGVGAVIGHEMTHGFDDQGAQYDKDGNLKNWWSRQDSLKFVAKTKAVIDLYNSFTVLDTVHVNGGLTNGENIADMGGVAISYDAFKLTKQGQDTAKIDGLTPDQRFFLSYAQIWKIRMKDELLRTYINTDQHSPPIWRVNGPLMNFPPFYRAFDMRPGQKMYKPDNERIRIW